jgi:hypothetical protein
MNILENAYITLCDHQLSQNQYDFSRRWLGMSRSYYSSLKATNGEPSIQALSKLFLRLEDEIEANRSIRSFAFSPSLRARQSTLNALRESVLESLRRNCCVE